jgi:hypothetical protein
MISAKLKLIPQTLLQARVRKKMHHYSTAKAAPAIASAAGPMYRFGAAEAAALKTGAADVVVAALTPVLMYVVSWPLM